MPGHSYEITCQIYISYTDYLPDGRKNDINYLATGSKDSCIIIWDYITCSMEKKLKGHTQAITALCTSKGGHKLISGSKDFTVKV